MSENIHWSRHSGCYCQQYTALTSGTNPFQASTIKVKGPKGNETTLNVQNPDQFKVVKKGDLIEVTYTEAIALSVEPAPKPEMEKQR